MYLTWQWDCILHGQQADICKALVSVYDPRIILVYMKYTINMHKNMDCWERFMKKHRSWHKKVHQDTTALIPEYYKTMNYEIAYYSKVKQDVAVHKNKRERERIHRVKIKTNPTTIGLKYLYGLMPIIKMHIQSCSILLPLKMDIYTCCS